jgi:antitoxin PrlF
VARKCPIPYNQPNCKKGRNDGICNGDEQGTTIPKEVREAAKLRSGDRIHFTVLEDGTILVRVKNRSIRELAVKPPRGKHVSADQMNR